MTTTVKAASALFISCALICCFSGESEANSNHSPKRRPKRQETEFKCPRVEGLYADPETCRKFYMCSDYYPFSQNCPSSLYFDDVKKFCTRKSKTLVCGPVETTATEPPTPDPSASQECDTSKCVLPECFCSSDGTQIPGGLDPDQTPQMILLTFDGGINALNVEHYRKLLNKSRTNPNGCSIKGTFFVSHEYTSHFLVQRLYSEGHEIAIHSITNRYPEEWWATASYEELVEEMVGQREILHLFSNISRDSLLGIRSPFIHPGGNAMMTMAYDYDFVYDSSIAIPMGSVPVWPYTLDYKIPHRCMQGTCPNHPFPGMWEIPLNTLYSEDGTGGMCTLADQCVFQDGDDESVEQFLKDNFERHYFTNRAPLILSFKVNWFNEKNKTKVLHDFVDNLLAKHKDVWFVTMQELITWMRDPTPASGLTSFGAWGCEKRDAPPCNLPNNCPVPLTMDDGFQEIRYMQTCQKCPLKYPWVGNYEGSKEGHRISELTSGGDDSEHQSGGDDSEQQSGGDDSEQQRRRR